MTKRRTRGASSSETPRSWKRDGPLRCVRRIEPTLPYRQHLHRRGPDLSARGWRHAEDLSIDWTGLQKPRQGLGRRWGEVHEFTSRTRGVPRPALLKCSRRVHLWTRLELRALRRRQSALLLPVEPFTTSVSNRGRGCASPSPRSAAGRRPAWRAGRCPRRSPRA